MKILVAGGSGFIGQRLVKSLQEDHLVTVLGRDSTKLKKLFSPPVLCITWDELKDINANDFDVVLNLSGYEIAAKRWTDAVKKELIDSRVQTTQTLIQWIMKHNAKPTFFCANAVGIYGAHAGQLTEVFDEKTKITFSSNQDFLKEIGMQWQQALEPAINYGLTVVSMRFGVVLGKESGMLKKLTPVFKLGLGSTLGDGKQVISWIQIDDLVRAIRSLLESPAEGAYNLTSPHCVTQSEFARTLAQTVKRPLLFTMPEFFIKLMFGEMGDCLLLKGQMVKPARLLERGFQFKYSTLKDALEHEVGH